MSPFCTSGCVTTVPVRLALAPCATCPDTPTQPEPTPGPVVETFNAPPSVISLDPSNPAYFVAGSGISAEFATVATDSVIELFLAPIIAGVSAEGPSTDGVYTVDLGPGQELGMVFGATILAPFRITQLYDVDLTVTVNGDSCTLALIRDTATLSGYTWTDGDAYNITDSDGNAGLTTVQYITRLTYLADGGLLPPDATMLGTSIWTMTATPKNGGDAVTVTVQVTTT